ncbi:unnamed protein product [Strongylus vulgaris]|uniref:glucuronosyltransferase n=1 Tax=Strongylus vulgaris TaxID=40348 RepID=A0A3P7JBF1_STRVU|nr:unnamed protein product [Strongylus vulgaris]
MKYILIHIIVHIIDGLLYAVPSCLLRIFLEILNDVDIISRLRETKFDVGIAEAFGICGFGIFEILGIRATIAATSSVQADQVSKLIGVPGAPSYVPGIANYTKCSKKCVHWNNFSKIVSI